VHNISYVLRQKISEWCQTNIVFFTEDELTLSLDYVSVSQPSRWRCSLHLSLHEITGLLGCVGVNSTNGNFLCCRGQQCY